MGPHIRPGVQELSRWKAGSDGRTIGLSPVDLDRCGRRRQVHTAEVEQNRVVAGLDEHCNRVDVLHAVLALAAGATDCNDDVVVPDAVSEKPAGVVRCVTGVLTKLTLWEPEKPDQPLVLGFRAQPPRGD